MFEAVTCQDSVSILEALILGANGACIDIGMTSLLGGIALFIGLVVLLRFVGARVLRRVLGGRRLAPAEVGRDATPDTEGLKPMPYESPIRSTGAWGGKAR